MNFDDSKAYRATSQEEVSETLSFFLDSVDGDMSRELELVGEYFGLVKGPGSDGTVSNSSSAADIPGERRHPSSGEIEDEDDPSVLKLGLSRSRSHLQRSNLGQSDSEDRLAGPPLINFNEPLIFMDNGGDFLLGGPGGVAGDHVLMDNPPVVGARAAISVRSLNSEDDLVSQLGLETPSLRNGSNNGTICCRHLSNHNISIASLDLEANNFNGHCHNFGQCCAHGYRHKLGGKTLRQRHFCVPAASAPL